MHDVCPYQYLPLVFLQIRNTLFESLPFNLRHVGHVGWDPKGGFDVSLFLNLQTYFLRDKRCFYIIVTIDGGQFLLPKGIYFDVLEISYFYIEN